MMAKQVVVLLALLLLLPIVTASMGDASGRTGRIYMYGTSIQDLFRYLQLDYQRNVFLLRFLLGRGGLLLH
uniref:Turripeptide OL179 n=1 Tax=Iotyrris olangoensis TaxID=2420066 RepID=TU179_IOTOL|nr:RecName: Full=Turripeptide OL179; Flags: Precursor [Iotyrris olangoensis]